MPWQGIFPQGVDRDMRTRPFRWVLGEVWPQVCPPPQAATQGSWLCQKALPKTLLMEQLFSGHHLHLPLPKQSCISQNQNQFLPNPPSHSPRHPFTFLPSKFSHSSEFVLLVLSEELAPGGVVKFKNPTNVAKITKGH